MSTKFSWHLYNIGFWHSQQVNDKKIKTYLLIFGRSKRVLLEQESVMAWRVAPLGNGLTMIAFSSSSSSLSRGQPALGPRPHRCQTPLPRAPSSGTQVSPLPGCFNQPPQRVTDVFLHRKTPLVVHFLLCTPFFLLNFTTEYKWDRQKWQNETII